MEFSSSSFYAHPIMFNQCGLSWLQGRDVIEVSFLLQQSLGTPGGTLEAQMVKNLPAMQETRV